MPDVTLDQASTNHASQSLVWVDGPSAVSPLSDPGADRVMGWDESANDVIWFTASTGLEFSTTNLQIDSTVATLTGTQTLTNKTLTAPTINAGALSGDFSGDADFTDAGVQFSGFGIFNVQHSDYGAAGDGVADDMAEIQAAIDAAEAAGGGIVYLPPGTYLATGTNRLTIDNHMVWLKGAGIGRSIIKLDDGISSANMTSASDLIKVEGYTVTNAEHVFISDLTIDGNQANQTYTSVATAAINAFNIIDGGIFRVEVKEWHSPDAPGQEAVAIHLVDSTRSYIADCVGSGNVETANQRLSGSVAIGDTTGCAIINCFANGGLSGQVVWQGEGCSVIGCTSQGVENDGLDLEDCKGCVATGNFIEEAGLSGIRLEDSVDCVVTGNVSRNNNQDGGIAGSTSGGITLQGASTRNVIANNQVYDDQGVPTQNYGVQELGAADTNYITGNTSTGSVIAPFLYAGANTKYLGNLDTAVGTTDTNLPFTFRGDSGDGTTGSRAAQTALHGVTKTTLKLELGLDTTGEFGLLQAVDEGTGFLPMILCQSGGSVGIGGLTAPGATLQVAGTGRFDNYVDFLEIATPGDPGAGVGRLYALTDGTLHYINDASLDIELGVAGGGGLANIVEDVTPQLGAQLDVNTFGLGDGTDELLLFSETVSAINEFTIANAATGNAPVLSATGDNTDIGITLTPKGTGNVTLGTMVFDSDQTIGAGQDNYVLTYDNGTGFISLEVATGGGLANIVEDTTPQIGGTIGLDFQGEDIVAAGVAFLTEQAAPESNVAGQGQLWVKDDVPNTLYFVDDAGGQHPLSDGLTATITGITADEILAWDGADWINRTMGEWFADTITDPGADRLIFWDDSGSAMAWSDVLYLTDTASGVNQITIASAIATAPPVVSATGTDTNIGITLTPKGTGNVILGTMEFDSDQAIGAGQDDYVLTYDNGTGFISLEAASGGGANVTLSNLTDGSVVINTTLKSDTDITDDLGTGDIRWKDIHAATLNAGLTAADTLILRGRDVDGATYVDVLTITSANTVTADLNAITTIGTNAILDSTWTGSTNVVTLGTIATGTWEATDVAVAHGGTGASDAATALSNLGGIGSVLADTSPQLGAMLDVNTFGIGDGTLELLSFVETGSAVNEFTITNAATGNPPILSATGDNPNIGITLTPKGTGNVTLGTMVFDSDQTIGAGQDNFILTYDNGTGFISLEAASGGGANTALSNLAAVAVSESLVSDTDITDDLGTEAIRWKDIYAATIGTGQTAADTFIVRGYDTDAPGFVDILTVTANTTVTADLNAITTIGSNAILDSTWTGSANIATVGTITSGVWTGTDVAVADGGTGASDAPTALSNLGGQTQGDVLDDFNTLGAAASDGQFIVATGAGVFAYESDSTARTSLGLGSAAIVATDLADLNEATIEAAIDTLANLTSVQGFTITLADAGADAILGWDDTAGAYENLTQAEVLAVIGDAGAAAKGVVELADATETTTGTDATRAITPDGLAGSEYGTRIVGILVEGGATDLTTGDSLNGNFFMIPDEMAGWDLVSVQAGVFAAGTTGNTDVQVNNHTQAADMLSTVMRIETTETTTETSAQPGTIDTANDDVAAGDIITIDVDAVQTGTAPKGLFVNLGFRLP